MKGVSSFEYMIYLVNLQRAITCIVLIRLVSNLISLQKIWSYNDDLKWFIVMWQL